MILFDRDLCLDFVLDLVRSCFSVEGMAPSDKLTKYDSNMQNISKNVLG